VIDFTCARRKTVRCLIWHEMNKRIVFDAIDELTIDTKFVTVYRIVWLRSQTWDKNIKKSRSTKPHERNWLRSTARIVLESIQRHQ